MRRWFWMIVAGLVLGPVSVYAVLRNPNLSQAERYGSWQTSLLTGSPEAGMWTRAQVALGGLLALSRQETIYLTAFEDETGRALDAGCVYRLEGGALPARWWSLTVYDSDHYLVPNPMNLHAFTRHDFEAMGMDAYSLTLSAAMAHGPWIPTAAGEEAGGLFSITLRLYNPAPEAQADIARVPLPRIRREMCREEAG